MIQVVPTETGLNVAQSNPEVTNLSYLIFLDRPSLQISSIKIV